jgi:predicted RNase H-related nuclease YkuK (DUF458 family)
MVSEMKILINSNYLYKKTKKYKRCILLCNVTDREIDKTKVVLIVLLLISKIMNGALQFSHISSPSDVQYLFDTILNEGNPIDASKFDLK